MDNDITNIANQQDKSSDVLPPLRIVKKVIEERKENIEPFTTIASTNGNDQEVLNNVKDKAKVR